MFFFPPLAFLSLGDRLEIGAVKCRKKQNKSRIVSCGINSFYLEKHSSPFLFLKPIDWLTMMLLLWNFQIPKMFCWLMPICFAIFFLMMALLALLLWCRNSCTMIITVQWCTARLLSADITANYLTMTAEFSHSKA